MKYLQGDEKKRALDFIVQSTVVAAEATCERSRCGSVIVKDDEVIGRGSNSPPGNQEKQRKCSNSKESYHKKVTDKTCCVHAEQRAIMDALRRNPDKLSGSRIYFARLDEKGNLSYAGKPYCTICSKMALDAGITEFVLIHKKGIRVYKTDEYNLISYEYSE